ncbi:protein PNS1-like [Henckelia pumila]|uniref:protein PNS1-like n=1 Tax=Henckelia pumila TaxID=405737 RepID=UPI003C6E8753
MDRKSQMRDVNDTATRIYDPRHSFSSRNKEIKGAESEMTRNGNIFSNLFLYIFYIHLLLITVLVFFLTLRGVLSTIHTHHFHLKKWYAPVLSSTTCGGIVGFAWQAFTSINPSRAVKTTFWLSPLLTCAFGILLVLIGTPGSLAASVIAIVSSLFQSLYACWVTPRFDRTYRIVTVSIAHRPQKVKTTVLLSIITSTIYSSFLMSAIGGATATGTKVDIISIFIILGSLTWTMQIIKNTMQVMVSHVKYMQFACGIEVDFKTIVKNTTKFSMGSICLGSILVPLLLVIRSIARAISMVSGDVDEFMFSCADCCKGFASSVVAYGNRWGFVQVGVYNKGIVQASMDTWDMFRRHGMEKLIDSDLTSSFCFLSGVAVGSICGLVGGTWALVIHKKYATEVSVYTFLTGYFTSRVAMAWIQASIAAYYVAYAENPQSQQFDSTMTDTIREIQRSQV